MTIASDFKSRLEKVIVDLEALIDVERNEDEQRYIASSLRILRIYMAEVTNVCEHYTPLALKRILGKLSSVNKVIIETGARWQEKHLELADKITRVSNQAFSARRSIDAD